MQGESYGHAAVMRLVFPRAPKSTPLPLKLTINRVPNFLSEYMVLLLNQKKCYT